MTENTWEQFVENCRRGYEQIKNELKEVDMLLQQTSVEVERFTQTNSRAVARARQIEASFDTAPREDIKATYESLIDNQRRLFTMRGQLEKLQSDQKNLTRVAQLYQEILENISPGDLRISPEAKNENVNTPQAMIVSIIEAQEQERLRLSRQMHDGPAQSLTNLVLQAEICERLFDRDAARAKTELAELKKNVVSAFKSVKGFIFDLRPMMLDDLGLVPTIRRYVEGLTDSGFTGLTLHITGKERRLARHKEVTIFRVIQTLVHMAREQGQAAAINIVMDIDDNKVTVTIEDNGSGFELDDNLTTPDALRLNLPTLRERIEMLGGKITFNSTPGQGSHVNFSLPAEHIDA
ncbi:MAG TPA: histidine kinase [Anaerolineae bacterium]|nr:histidine kinase [Anaerolineae bacterium]HQH37423.1 histidine kinase [Anaerolineae bacterium]